jgi:glycosyltransferase involved in cell wall biosynthesis
MLWRHVEWRQHDSRREKVVLSEMVSDNPLVSIITVCYNSAETIGTAVESVLSQNYPAIEYIVIDGGSKDSTMDVVRRYRDAIAKVVSEPDRGIYDAMNKGVSIARGEVVGLLNADDYYADCNVIADLIRVMRERGTDCVFADVEYVKRENAHRVVRYYDSSHWNVRKFRYGWIPAHPTFFIKKCWYVNCGYYSLDYRIAADFEWLLRVLYKGGATYSYLGRAVVRMRVGGVSTASWRHRWILNREIVRACKQHGIRTTLLLVLLKIPRKLSELTVVREKFAVIRGMLGLERRQSL